MSASDKSRDVGDIVCELAWLMDEFKDSWSGHKLLRETQNKLQELDDALTAANTKITEQAVRLREAEIKTVPPKCMITMGDDELTALLPDGNSGSYTEEIIERLISQAKRANALAAEVTRLNERNKELKGIYESAEAEVERLRKENGEYNGDVAEATAHYKFQLNRAESAERRCDVAVAALKLMREEYAKLPHSLGYSFTHLPKIDKAIKECGKC